MNEIATIDIPDTTLALSQALTPAVAFAPGAIETLIEKVEREARAFRADVSKPEGRKAIKSMAHKVARTKTALDGMGKALTDEIRKQSESIHADRRIVVQRLDALAAEVRRPLTEYEEAEKARIARLERALAALVEPLNYGLTETASEIAERIAFLREHNAGLDWGGFRQQYNDTIASEIARAERLHAAAVTREKEAAELAQLRAEQAERDRLEAIRQQEQRDAQIAARAAEQARIEAERVAERERQETLRAAAEERARIKREHEEARLRQATELQRVEQERQAAEERARQAEADAIAAAERAKAARVAAAERAERDKAEALAAERRRVEEANAAEVAAAEKRAADKAHRAKINRAAVVPLVALGFTEEQAKLVIAAIASGNIPNVMIRY